MMAMKTWTNKSASTGSYRYIGTGNKILITGVSPPTSIKMQIARVAKVVPPVKIRFQQYITVKEVLLLQSLLYFVLN
jgi:hypothetical protein